MEAEDVVDEYIEEGLPQKEWRSRLEGEGIGNPDGVLEDAYGKAKEYHDWLDAEIGKFPIEKGHTTLIGLAVALGVGVLAFYLIRRKQNGAKSKGT